MYQEAMPGGGNGKNTHDNSIDRPHLSLPLRTNNRRRRRRLAVVGHARRHHRGEVRLQRGRNGAGGNGLELEDEGGFGRGAVVGPGGGGLAVGDSGEDGGEGGEGHGEGEEDVGGGGGEHFGGWGLLAVRRSEGGRGEW